MTPGLLWIYVICWLGWKKLKKRKIAEELLIKELKPTLNKHDNT